MDKFTLIATLPPVYREELLERMIREESVGEVRYNTGMTSPFSAEETLGRIAEICDAHEKPLWIDIKGRQLRVTEWAKPDYARIVLNHEIELDGPAVAVFRDGTEAQIKFAQGNVIYLDGAPKHAVGAGQSLNVLGLATVKGYLTDTDKEYIRAARTLGIKQFMLSFVESESDVKEATDCFGSDDPPEFGLKIESDRGLKFAHEWIPGPVRTRLIAARDDLYTNTGAERADILDSLEMIVARDPAAIVASRLLLSLEGEGDVSIADLSDVELMKRMGYRSFMLSDEICHRHFDEAIRIWSSLLGRFVRNG